MLALVLTACGSAAERAAESDCARAVLGDWGDDGTGVRTTNDQGAFSVSVRAPAGAGVRLYSVRDRAYGLELRV